MSVLDYIFYFFFYSFVGWFIESCYCSIRPRKWVNRGFLRGPICPIYGTGAMVILLILVPLRDLTDNLYVNELLIFLVGMIVCDIVEFMTSYIMEKLFNARWWDYSGMKFNIQGRICLTHTIYWGTLSCLFCYVIHPIVDNFFIGQISESSRNIIVYIILTVFFFDLLDTVINALGIRDISGKFKKISEDISTFAIYVYSNVGIKLDHSANETRTDLMAQFEETRKRYDEFKEDAKKLKTKSKQRLLKAFPFLKEGLMKQDTLLEDLLDDLNDKINNNKEE